MTLHCDFILSKLYAVPGLQKLMQYNPFGAWQLILCVKPSRDQKPLMTYKHFSHLKLFKASLLIK